MRSLFIMAFLIGLWSCKVRNDDGLAVLPADTIDGSYSDQHPITIQTLPIDSTITSGLSYQTIGKIQDNSMGTLQAEAYIQFLLSGTNVNFGDPSKITLDSLELWLYVTSYYGDSTEIAPIEIYEINQPFHYEETFYHFSTLTTEPNNLSTTNEFQITLDSTGNFTKKVYKIKLDNSLGNKLLFANSTYLQDNTQFRDFFKGLKIVSKHQNLMLGLETISDSSRLVLHYKLQENDTLITNKTYNFYSDPINAAKFTHYERNATGSLYEQSLLNNSQTYGFISAGAQNQLFIKISTDSIHTQAVNKAELELPIDTTTLANSFQHLPPSLLYLYSADENQKITGNIITSASYQSDNKKYSFIITNKINNYLRKTEDNHGFIIVPAFPGSSVNRAVLLGPQNTGTKLRLKVYSTQIN